MAVQGMDVAQVKQLASQLQQASSQVEQITKQLTSELHSVPWKGPDQQKFESEWTGQHVQQLNQVSQALDHASKAANQNADQQASASRA